VQALFPLRSGSARVLNGIDANYTPLMRAQGLEWRDRGGREIANLFAFFRERGVSCFRLRIWFGGEGPSRLPVRARAR